MIVGFEVFEYSHDRIADLEKKPVSKSDIALIPQFRFRQFGGATIRGNRSLATCVFSYYCSPQLRPRPATGDQTRRRLFRCAVLPEYVSEAMYTERSRRGCPRPLPERRNAISPNGMLRLHGFHSRGKHPLRGKGRGGGMFPKRKHQTHERRGIALFFARMYANYK